jgi:DNA-binding MarR family transcriptional regulator
METTLARVGVGELAGRLRLVVARTARRLRQQADSPLSPSLHAALVTVANHGPVTPSELARRERVQRPNATKLIARLEADRLVERTDTPDDGRSTLIAITPAGQALLAETRTRKDAYLARRLRALPAADRATLARAADLLEELLSE